MHHLTLTAAILMRLSIAFVKLMQRMFAHLLKHYSPDHGHSISGYAMVLGNGCFSWSSKKQTATVLSTGEAEYYAVTHAGCEVIWL
jgi:hypothetical protein